MTRVLLLSPFAPNASHNHAAADTIVQLVPRLAQRTELFVYAPGGSEDTGAPYTMLRPSWTPQPGVRDRLGRRPAWLRQAWPHAANEEVDTLVRRLQPDVVHAEYLQGAEALRNRRNSVLGLHDITENVMAQSYRASSGLARPYRLAELVRTRTFERAAIRGAGAVLTLSDADHKVASALNPNTLLARPGVEVGPVAWAPPPPAAAGPRLVFAGAMWRRANVLVAQYLAGEVMPQVWRDFPAAQLRIVGADPTDEVTQLGVADGRIVVTGAVPDLRDEMLQAHAVVVPSIVGGGVLMKVVHAMALGCPVVTSPGPADSVRGDASMLFTGETAEELAAAIGTALHSPEDAAARGARAREHIRRTFRWEDTVEAYLAAYKIAGAR
ncbi:glycosyltransferase [Dactylosporangium sp. NPDC051541]|uniref:glycosyltransferase n=1 Tax=Dactylosporangium sp. NPDC051541 TaxID=3363977 RepID=UPI0037B52195